MRRASPVLLWCLAASALAGPPAPDTSRILAVIGRMGAAHACPVAPRLAVTNGHVTDPKPFDTSAPTLPHRFSNLAGVSGSAKASFVSMREDLAELNLSEDVTPYPVAAIAPAIGEQLWWVGYDWRKKRDAFRQRVMTGKVLYVVAGNVVLDERTPEGSSGSCVLNARGEAVAVVAWGMPVGHEEVAVMVGIWGTWLDNFAEARAAKEREAQP